MKKTIYSIFAVASLAAMLTSCYKQSDIYDQYVVVGGLTYPAKSLNLAAAAGYNRIVLTWDLPQDPSIRTAKIFWDNYTDSLSINYRNYPDGHVSVSIDDLEERSYTFDVVNYDDPGNKSLAAELTARPLGDSWLVTHAERRIVSSYMVKDTAVITMSKSTDEMVATRFRVYDTFGNKVIYETYLRAGENEIRIPQVMKGKKFEFSSSFYEDAAADTIWNPTWTKSSTGIPYALNTTGWTVKATANQVRSGYDPEKIFDGVSDNSLNSWFSSSSTTYRNRFPKILSIDTGETSGERYTITGFGIYQHATNPSYRYIKDLEIYTSDQSQDPDDASYAEDFGTLSVSVNVPQNDAFYQTWLSDPVAPRYFALVFKNSRSAAYGYIDLWELVPYGYLESESE